MASDLVRIYLQDHFAAATGGLALARRVAANNAGTPQAATTRLLADEIAADRDTLAAVMATLGVMPVRAKNAVMLAGERLGRLKLNGSVVRRSPLSGVVEFEALLIGVQGKVSCWQALRALAEHDDRVDTGEFDALLARADDQRTRVEGARATAVREALVGKG